MLTSDLKREEGLGLASINRPFPGEPRSGDMPFWKEDGEDLLIGLCDGIGHGPTAHGAVQEVARALETLSLKNPVDLLKALDKAIRPSPGVAMSLGWLNRSSGNFAFSGIGNVFACLLTSSGPKRLVTRDGMLGQNIYTPMLQEFQLMPGDRVIMASDGIKERFYTQVQERRLRFPPAEVCWALVNDYGKNHDDASCIVVEVPK